MGDHEGGLQADIATLFERRQLLRLFAAGAGLVVIGAACGSDKAATSPPSTSGGSMASTASSSASVTRIPEETAGPYPGDGSNGVDVLTQAGIVRSDIRSSFGTASGVAPGVPLTIVLRVVDATTGSPRRGAAVYVWHCDRAGSYSMYSSAAKDQNYLRGVQETGVDGTVSFTSIYPACYSGRWPHIHFEVFPSLDAATSAGTRIATSQIALTEDVSDTVYATAGYEQSVRNLQQVSLATDNVFRDGATLETPTVTGSMASGFAVAMAVGV